MELPDLSSVPEPEIVSVPVIEDILADVKAYLVSIMPAIEPVLAVESSTANKVIQACVYRVALLYADINDAARANLVLKATGGDLDQKGVDYGVTRLEGELDDDFRARILLAIFGRSTAGPEEWYEFHAYSADVRIKQVRVYRIDGGPTLGIAILSKEDGGVPDSEMLEAVEAAVTASGVRGVNDVVEVHAATQTTTNIAADVWMLPGTPAAVFAGLEARLRAAWAAESGIGFDLDPSWIAARLHAPGVKRVVVNQPAAPVVVAEPVSTVLGTITLVNKGELW